MQQWIYDMFCFWCQIILLHLFRYAISFACQPHLIPFKEQTWDKKGMMGEKYMGTCISQGTGECPSLPQYAVHTTPKVFFHVSMLARTEVDRLYKQTRTDWEAESNNWSQTSLGSCHIIEDGGQSRGSQPPSGPTLTNQIWQSPSLLLRLLSCFTSLLSLPSRPLCSTLRFSGADSDRPARSKALSFSRRWWGWRENQISQGSCTKVY